MEDLKIIIPYPKMKNFAKRFGLNAIYAGKHWAKRKEDKDYWDNHVRVELIKQGINRGIYTSPVALTFSWNDRLDCSNHAYMAKMIEDSLKGCLIKDDSRKYVQEITHRFHDLPYILLEIRVMKELVFYKKR